MKKTTIKLSEFASICNRTARWLRLLSEQGTLPPIKRGLIAWPDCVTALFLHYQKTSEETAQERLALLRVNRASKEMELATAQKKLVARDVITATFLYVLRSFTDSVRAEMELNPPSRRLEKLKALGVTPEIAALFHEFDVCDSQMAYDRMIERAKATELKTDENEN